MKGSQRSSTCYREVNFQPVSKWLRVFPKGSAAKVVIIPFALRFS